MKVRDYFITIAKTFHPNSYKQFVKAPLKDAFKYFWFLMIISMIVFLILLVPKVFNLSNSLGSKLDNFDTLELDVEMELNDPFYMFYKPKVLFNFNNSNMTDEQVLITQESISYKPFFFFGKRQVVFDDYHDLLANKDDVRELLPMVGLFILPSILFWVFIFYAAKFLLTILLASLIALLIMRKKHKFNYILKIGLYASTFMLILELALLPYYKLSLWIPTVVFLIYFVLGVWLTSDKEFVSKKKKGDKPDFRPKHKMDTY